MGERTQIPPNPQNSRYSVQGRATAPQGAYQTVSIQKYLGGGEGYPARVLEKGQKMQRITNIYLLIDTSLYMKANAEKIRNILTKTERALAFIPQKTKLHIWGYNDEARLIGTNGRIITHGNPNLAEGLKAIKNAVLYERKYSPYRTRSIFIIHTSGKALLGWEFALGKLFKLREFAFGHRYAVTYGKPDDNALKAIRHIVDSDEKILHYFSEKRLCALVRDIHEKEKKKCYNSYTRK